MAYGGRVAEELVFGLEKVTPGAAQDIQQATNIARRMVTQVGMSEAIGPAPAPGADAGDRGRQRAPQRERQAPGCARPRARESAARARGRVSAPDLAKLRIDRDRPPPAVTRAFKRILWFAGAAALVFG